jgi:hypothetical protein
MDETDLISTIQAAAFIGCSRRSIENYRRRGWLHPIRLANSRILFVRKEVERLRETLLRTPPKGRLIEAAAQKRDAYVSLKNDPDPIIFKSEVWDAVRQYQEARKAR